MIKKWPVVIILFVIVAAGCVSSKTEAESRREAFRLSHVPKAHQSAFLKANGNINKGDSLYSQARSTRELKQRTRLLQAAADSYRKAIVMLRKIHEETSEDADKSFVIEVLRHTESSLQETVRMLPIFEE